ncbi:MAG: NAD(P)/FAD-dependent oxidoreductase [Halobacteriovoraceae bacterium]|nr:NAD(P)/FAD-dependent oxidoreductase [Halobacteriovoraceae bacterium]MBT5095190.1 NAD(P)/FAD-dependent oxidoreductase [Halobacteriovoraceae bacterium]
MSYDAIVIGAGHNGLTTAGVLAKRGKKVLIVEERQLNGGLASSHEFHQGHRTNGLLQDTSLLRREAVKKLNLTKHGLVLESSAPDFFTPSKEGKGLCLYGDLDQACLEIATFSKKDAIAYRKFRKYIAKVSKVVAKFLNTAPIQFDNTSIKETWGLFTTSLSMRMLGEDDMLELLRIPPMAVADWLNEWFESDLLKANLIIPAIAGTHCGAWSPGTALNLLFSECIRDVAVKGGPQNLISSLVKANQELGVEFKNGTAVKKILVENGKTRGVLLNSGEEILAPVVASSCDPKKTMQSMVSPFELDQKFDFHIKNFRQRGTTAVVNLALKSAFTFDCRPDFKVEFARIGESANQIEKAHDSIKYRMMSEDPALELYVASHANPELAPAGGATVSILVHFAPYHLEQGWDQKAEQKLLEIVLKKLETYTSCIRTSVTASQVLSPPKLEAEYRITGGHIHHGEKAIDQLMVRPTPETARYQTPIAGLYLCGSGNFPGGDLTCAPGLLAAQVIQ